LKINHDIAIIIKMFKTTFILSRLYLEKIINFIQFLPAEFHQKRRNNLLTLYFLINLVTKPESRLTFNLELRLLIN